MTKDIHFNKEKVFNSNTESFKCNIKNNSLKYLVKIVKKAIRTAIIVTLLIIYNNTAKDLEWSYEREGNKKKFNP